MTVDGYLTFENGEIRLGGYTVPGVLKSLYVNSRVKFDESEQDGLSGKVKIPMGWDDADITATVELLTDEFKTCYDKLQELNKIFRGTNNGGNPNVYDITNSHSVARAVERVVFSGLSSSETDQDDVIAATLNFVEHIPPVTKIEKRVVKKASNVSEADAMDYVAGYVLHNDVSEREWQLERGGTWDKGKGCDTFAPLGPFLATKDEIVDPHNLRLWLKLNGKMLQDSNTDDLIFNIPFLISYVSKFMTLLPGDVVSTGTPAGVGLGLNPPVYLKHGDVVELGIDGLGISKQEAIAYAKD
jgi:hypothetical protein